MMVDKDWMGRCSERIEIRRNVSPCSGCPVAQGTFLGFSCQLIGACLVLYGALSLGHGLGLDLSWLGLAGA